MIMVIQMNGKMLMVHPLIMQDGAIFVMVLQRMDVTQVDIAVCICRMSG